VNQSSFSFNKAFKLVSKVISWAFFIVLLIAAAFLLYYFVATKIYAAKGPGYEPKFSIYTIVSPSMTPNINVYDTIINVRIDDPNDLEVGDVITFISTSILSPGVTITHRIIGITLDENGNVCYQTRGDANNIADQACAKFNNILGKVVFKIPQLGRIQFFLASKAGWLLCILIPALVIITKDILRILKLSNIKSAASKISEVNKMDPKKVEQERMRKEELKRKLLKENTNDEEYYIEPSVNSIDKRIKSNKKTTYSGNKSKKKGKTSKKS